MAASLLDSAVNALWESKHGDKYSSTITWNLSGKDDHGGVLEFLAADPRVHAHSVSTKFCTCGPTRCKNIKHIVRWLHAGNGLTAFLRSLIETPDARDEQRPASGAGSPLATQPFTNGWVTNVATANDKSADARTQRSSICDPRLGLHCQKQPC